MTTCDPGANDVFTQGLVSKPSSTAFFANNPAPIRTFGFDVFVHEVIAAIIILTREILISGLREFLAKGEVSMQVTGLAKLKTFLQMLSIAILLTGESGNKLINFQDYNAQTIGIILLWLSAFLTLYTGYDYVRKGIDHAISEDKKN